MVSDPPMTPLPAKLAPGPTATLPASEPVIARVPPCTTVPPV